MFRHRARVGWLVRFVVLVGWGLSNPFPGALGQDTQRVSTQRPKTPAIPQLVENYQNMTYDGLVAALPGEPTYRKNLDFDPTKARYFDLVRKELALTQEEIEIYRRCGLVSLDNGRGYTFTTAYYDIYTSDLPVLITSDSILHALHQSYDTILQELETTWFTWSLDEILAEMHVALDIVAAENRNPRLV